MLGYVALIWSYELTSNWIGCTYHRNCQIISKYISIFSLYGIFEKQNKTNKQTNKQKTYGMQITQADILVLQEEQGGPRYLLKSRAWESKLDLSHKEQSHMDYAVALWARVGSIKQTVLPRFREKAQWRFASAWRYHGSIDKMRQK